MAKLWGGRFSKDTNALVDAFNASIEYDKRLYHEDIRGSIAHAHMLAKTGIISQQDGDAIVKGLEKILLGSVADRVVKQAPCPVLLFNPFRHLAAARR